MKILPALFLLFVSTSFGQKSTTLVTTYYFDNGNMEETYEYDSITNHYNGFYKKFDEEGALTIDGHYKQMDSVKCKDCYEGIQLRNGTFMRFYYVKKESVKTGVWKYYYPNGKLQMQGKYAEMVHAHGGTKAPDLTKADSGPVNVWITYDDLKEGEWDYFDESGKKTRTETYYEGALIYTLSYE